MTSVRLPAPAAPKESAVLRDVRHGLTQRQRELPPKYFYDHRGSELFEEITRLPEYYLTRAERRLLVAWMPSLMRELRPSALVELGAGSGEKTRIILEQMRLASAEVRYLPIDVSADFLAQSADRLRAELPWLEVEPVVADFSEEFTLPRHFDGRALFAFLGSTIGNLEHADAVSLLRTVRHAMRPADRLLLGADLHSKPVERIISAYNDAAGVTAEFNRNMLRVLNRAVGADFDLDDFEHRATWSWAHRRIEMHLVARRPVRVSVPGLGTVGLGEGESIRTEICCKYDRERIDALLHAAGLVVDRWHVDEQDAYSIVVAAPLAQECAR